MDSRFDVGQVAELRRIEDARIRRGQPGLRSEFHEFIARLTSGGVAPGQPGKGKRRKGKGGDAPARHPLVLLQAKLRWNKGWGRELGIGSFEEYLETIPDIPAHLFAENRRLPHLVLVDRRIALTTMCRLLNVTYEGTDATLVPHDQAKAISASVYWVRMQDGRQYRNRKPSDCRTEFASQGEVGLEAHEGLALYAQNPDALELGYVWDLPGSVHAVDRESFASLRRWADDDVRLDWGWDDAADPYCGSASRGSV